MSQTTTNSASETLGFQAEVKQLLHLMIHSLYSNKEIFLRELVSNASDACDKLRFEAIDQPGLLDGDGELAIRVDYDKAARTITISDNGIGLSRDEAVANLGTIARSGTREFFSQLTGDKQKDAQLIGQFGVGFYSSFIVADKVTVLSRRAGLAANEAIRWESDGQGEFSIAPAEKAGRGTDVVLHLRADEDELLNGWKLREILRRYSDHISLPIRMAKEDWDAEKGEQVKGDELETVNQANALWTRNKSDITDEQYREFYKTVSHDYDDPLAWTHNRVEGRSEYTQLLYVPRHAPFDLWDRDARRGVKLYVKRVFIMDDAEQLLPSYLRFVRGVIDSADLPLNVSREILQESRDVRAIREGSAKRVLSLLEDMAENKAEDYATFWTEFGQVLKEGTGEDAANRERIARLLCFASTHDGEQAQTVSFADYVGRMKDGQDKIYYVTADTFTAAANSPHLEIFRKKGIEVLLLSDRVDEWMLSYLREFDGKSLVSVAKGGLDLAELADEEEKKRQSEVAETFKPLVERLQQALAEQVKEVRVTQRLVDSPACVVVGQNELSPHLLRMLKAAGQEAPEVKPVLEINPDHALIARIRDASDAEFGDWAALLLDQALLAEGAQIADPAAFVKRLNGLLLKA
ncbi:molecular chaperone HtpG [Bordetella parapertussis]|uniref:Chaperone protein HtpG n=2 Tax=Bordetella parapertussis TaxID=519 RepID=HTPG_BORPA|nr:molecular chaperone HtpG [Bordetella parapertussis]Q7WC32.1 RecName: Full=Chaperone protein HtpG; AltName: Full=Heat shock protein HtpG; AltName: Full=High temperature protein G [Bordetella parapertussis 12822]AOB37839.1 molecular chaperone HtpG [Bordetella parapertussis]AUL41805.1 molecular chaperone HtpG [Bordetella parapertussis]AWP61719.1 molecular chaperone HtpG [Bordetella parapertussis]AWP69216.1 molecular chaperone HtpG [Bordetella parapertussis]AWP87808.1 molecular chaperone HtpG 